MSNNKQSGSKPKATNGDDVLVGTSKNDNLSGKKGDDQISGLAGNDKLKGDQGRDVIDGGSGNDKLYGGQGDDRILGGTGNDVLYGDDGKSKGWGWDKFCWWKPKSDDDDYLDGGAGSDKVYGGKGDDVAVYSMAGNLGAGFKNIGTKDEYDGGSGDDTLVLQLTYGEAALGSVKQDIASFQKFLDSRASSRGDEFEFKSFNLDVRNFEDLRVELVNTGPTARNDAGATSEDSKLVVAGSGLLANDSDADHLDVLSVVGGSLTSAKGAAVVLGANGGYSYDPTASLQLQKLGQGQTATDTFSYTITDLGGATATATVSVTVTGRNDAPIAVADSFGTDEDTALSGSVLGNDTDVDSPALTAALVSTAANGTLAFNADGSFTYTPNANFFGTDSFTYKASDGALGSNVATVNLTIRPVNDAPVAKPDDLTLDEDTTLSSNVLANDLDVDSPALTATLMSTTANGTLAFNGNGSFTYTPNANFSGTDSFTYKASDGAADSNLTTVSLTIKPVNDAPVANPDELTLDEDTTLSSNVLANDMDADGPAALTATLVSSTTNGTLAFSANGSFTYTPNADFNGSDSFTYKANDGAADSNLTTVNLNVNPVNDAPVVEDEPVIGGGGGGGSEPASQGSPYLVSSALLLAGITDPEGDPLSITEVAPLSELGAAVSLDENGNVVYDPTEGLKYLAEGEEVTDTFTYTVSDGQASFARFASFSATSGGTIATASIKVKGVNDAPAANPDSFTLNEDTTLTANVLGNDVDPDSPVLSASLVSGAAHGAVTLNANGSFTYTPTANFFGSDSFSYKASDGSLDSAATTVSLTVNNVAEPQPQPPSKVLPSVDQGADLDYYIRFDDGGATQWLHLEGFSWGAETATGAIGGTGGLGAGKAVAQDVHTTMGSSNQLVQLMQDLTSGKHLNGVEIEAYARGGDKPQLVEQYYFEEVLLTGLQSSGSSSTVHGLSFDYAAFNRGHVTHDAKGGVSNVFEDGFDFRLNKDANGIGPEIAGDAIGSKVEGGIGGELHYYVTFTGAQGWLELDSFSVGLSATGSAVMGGGGGAGKASGSPVHLSLGSSKELLLLSDALTDGKHLQNLEIEAYNANGDKLQLVDQYYFEDVLVSSLSSANAGNQVSVEYGKFSHGHIEQNDKGGAEPAVESGWDFEQNVAFSTNVDSDFNDKTLSSVNQGADLDYYIRFDDGGATQWLHLEGFSWGASNSGSVSSGGGAGAGKPNAQDVHATMGSSNQLVQLMQDLTSGKHLNGVEIEAYARGGDKPQLVEQYYFEEVLLTSLQSSGSSSASAVHNLSFDYAAYNRGHVTLDAKGGVSNVFEDGFDFRLNKDANGIGPEIAGDAIGSKVEGGIGGELHYYATFTGAQGWLELDSFSVGLSATGSVVIGGGGGAGKAEAGPLSFSLGSSKELLLLADALTEGKHLQNLEIEAYNANGDKLQLVDQYYFEDVLVSSLSSSGASNQVSVEYSKFSHGHIEQNDKGGAEPAVESGWDFKLSDTFSTNVDSDFNDKTLPSGSQSADLDYYIRFDDNGPTQWLHLESFSWGASNSGSLAGGGAGAGKPNAQDIHTMMGSSNQLVDLMQLLAGGKHLEGVEIEAYASGGGEKPQLVEQYYFEDVLLTSLQSSGSSSASAIHSLSFDYAAYNRGHITLDAKGGVSSVFEDGFDFRLSKDANGLGPSITGDAVGSKVEGAIGGELQYYVTFTGAQGWLELDSFSVGLTQTGSSSSGGGGGAGRVQGGPLSFSLGSSKELLLLADGLTEGKHLQNLEIEAYRDSDGKPQLVDQYYFEDVLVSSLSSANATNQVSIEYGKFSHGHIEQNDKGGAEPAVESGWDFELNKAFSTNVDSDLF